MSNDHVDRLRNFSPSQIAELSSRYSSPLFAYSERVLRENARAVLAFPSPFGLVGRYAMKACPTRAILELFHQEGLHIDARSGYEVERALAAGVPPSHISLTTQEMPHNLESIIPAGVLFSATTLNLGGGFKVARMKEEVATNLAEVGKPVSAVLEAYGWEKGREITLEIEPGTFFVVESAGAYCSAMPAKNYKSFPEAAEVLVKEDGTYTLIRKRQTLEQIMQNEVPL